MDHAFIHGGPLADYIPQSDTDFPTQYLSSSAAECTIRPIGSRSNESTVDDSSVSTPTNSATLRCTMCGVRFQCQFDLDDHIIIEHLKKTSTTESDSVTIETNISSGQANDSVSTPDSLPQTDQLLCRQKKPLHPQIGKCLSQTSKTLWYHKKAVLECLDCNISFTSAKAKQEHKKSISHVNNKLIRPKHSRLLLPCHDMIPGGWSEKVNYKYRCEHCEKLFRSRLGFRMHMNNHAKEPISAESPKASRDHQCLVCGKSFAKKVNLVNHELTHSGNKPYCCHICDKRFVQLTSLNNHMLTHLGQKPHTCTVCQKSFTQNINLIEHRRLQHPSHHTFQCPVCNEAFPDNFALKTHKKTHTIIKGFHCRFCEKRFVTEAAAIVHNSLCARNSSSTTITQNMSMASS